MPFTKETASEAGKKSKRGLGEKTKELRKAIRDYCIEDIDSIIKEIRKLQGKDKIEYYLRVLEYGLGKLNRTDITTDGEKFNFNSISDNELINKLNGIAKALSPGESTDQ